MVFGLSAFGLASVLGMIWAFAANFVPGGKLVKMLSNVVVAIAVVLIAFSAIFSNVGLDMLTNIMIVGWLFFFGVGYAAASLISDLFGL